MSLVFLNHRLKRDNVDYGFGEFPFIFLFSGIFSKKNQIERVDVIAMGTERQRKAGGNIERHDGDRRRQMETP